MAKTNLICLSNILEIVAIYNSSNMGSKKALQKIRYVLAGKKGERKKLQGGHPSKY
jgi:hypothetical protein